MDIQYKNVSVSYQKKAIVRDISLTIKQGEVFALLGCNGAGKSTTVKALLDFIQIDSGEVVIAGQPHTQAEARKALAFVPEKFTPPYYLTGQQFINFTLDMHKALRDAERVNHFCDLLGFPTEALTASIKSYSKGMAQKLGLIAALATDKSILVFDEPMSGLDPQARAQLRMVFEQLKAEGKTLFFCTHMLTDVEAVCDRIALLHNGQLRFVGTPTECCQQFNADKLEQAFLYAIKPE